MLVYAGVRIYQRFPLLSFWFCLTFKNAYPQMSPIAIFIAATLILVIFLLIRRAGQQDKQQFTSYEDPWDHLSDDSKPRSTPSTPGKSKSASTSGYFRLYGNKSMDLADFYNTVLRIQYGDELDLVYEDNDISVYFDGLRLGTHWKYVHKAAIINALKNEDSVHALCAGNNSWYDDQEDIKGFNIYVEWEIGQGEISQSIELFKNMEEIKSYRAALIKQKKEAAALKKINPERAFDAYLKLLQAVKDLNERLNGTRMVNYQITYPLNQCIILAQKYGGEKLTNELLNDYYLPHKETYTDNQKEKFDKLLG